MNIEDLKIILHASINLFKIQFSYSGVFSTIAADKILEGE